MRSLIALSAACAAAVSLLGQPHLAGASDLHRRSPAAARGGHAKYAMAKKRHSQSASFGEKAGSANWTVTRTEQAENITASSFGRSPYTLVQDSSGLGFFDDFDFFTDADPTHGSVDYQSAAASRSAGLISVGPNSLFKTNHRLAALSEPLTAIMKVDSTSWLAEGQNRKSVRVVSKQTFQYGLLVLDAVKMPYGCSTWPAFWTVGSNWPNGGEIDIVEGVNNLDVNQMTLHTAPGCTLASKMSHGATGTVLSDTCDANVNYNAGCGVHDNTANSYGAGFNSVGGGVFAMEWTESGISVWHFARDDIPVDLIAQAPVPSTWGAPAAFWSASTCDMSQYFGAQNIVFDITLCGDWAAAVYSSEGCSGTCAQAVMDPTNFENAVWEVASVRLYQEK